MCIDIDECFDQFFLPPVNVIPVTMKKRAVAGGLDKGHQRHRRVQRVDGGVDLRIGSGSRGVHPVSPDMPVRRLVMDELHLHV